MPVFFLIFGQAIDHWSEIVELVRIELACQNILEYNALKPMEYFSIVVQF